MQISAGHGRQFLHNFDLDIYPGLRFIPGRVYELIGYKQDLWPGHGLPADAETYQFVEAEYVMLRALRVKSRSELKERTLKYIDELNQMPVIFKWKYKMDQITIGHVDSIN
jgi:hypothetical protein